MHQQQGAIFAFAALTAGAGLLIALTAFVSERTSELVLTDRCLIAKWGLLSRNTVDMALSRVGSLDVSQTMKGGIRQDHQRADLYITSRATLFE